MHLTKFNPTLVEKEETKTLIIIKTGDQYNYQLRVKTL